jgi:preprotein translocase subunit SecE
MNETRSEIIEEKIKKVSYFQEVKNEFLKITWTTKDELIFFTKVVLGATFVMGFAIFFTDIVIQKTLLAINILGKWIIG